MKTPQTRLTRSIGITITSLLAFQCAVYAAFAFGYGISTAYSLPFGATTVAFHVMVLVMLLRFRDDFVIEETGEKLERVNLANVVTLVRLSSLPTVLFLVLAAKDYPIRGPLVALVAAVFATDFLDGWISRTRRQVTRIGKLADSTSDYSLIVVLSVVYQYYFLIPTWFFALIVSRLALQTVFAFALLAIHGSFFPKATFLGKATIAGTMGLYALETVRLFVPTGYGFVWLWAERLVGLVVAASIVDKTIAFAKHAREAASRRKGSGKDQDPASAGTEDTDKE
ncbi:MAG: CDP-alcohol phosphatidyltransferase family protein [Spirochaetales bacterium]|nr:CDP-alcohol phosphatidyltransferase family protein [Spirochaetales bacterium]